MISQKFKRFLSESKEPRMSLREAKRICEKAGYIVKSNSINESSKEQIIWSNEYGHLDYEFDSFDWDDYAEINNIDPKELSDAKKRDIIYEINDEYLHDEKLNLGSFNKGNNQIIAIHTHNTWNGSRARIEVVGDEPEDILNFSGDYDTYKVYYDGNDVRCEATHHDGRNFLLFREMKQDFSEEEFEDFVEDFNNASQKERSELINKYTRSLSRIVKYVYGW